MAGGVPGMDTVMIGAVRALCENAPKHASGVADWWCCAGRCGGVWRRHSSSVRTAHWALAVEASTSAVATLEGAPSHALCQAGDRHAKGRGLRGGLNRAFKGQKDLWGLLSRSMRLAAAL